MRALSLRVVVVALLVSGFGGMISTADASIVSYTFRFTGADIMNVSPIRSGSSTDQAADIGLFDGARRLKNINDGLHSPPDYRSYRDDERDGYNSKVVELITDTPIRELNLWGFDGKGAN